MSGLHLGAICVLIILSDFPPIWLNGIIGWSPTRVAYHLGFIQTKAIVTLPVQFTLFFIISTLYCLKIGSVVVFNEVTKYYFVGQLSIVVQPPDLHEFQDWVHVSGILPRPINNCASLLQRVFGTLLDQHQASWCWRTATQIHAF